MAKALLGHVGPADPLVFVEVERLRRRVRELEAAMMRLQAENDALAAAVRHDDCITLDDRSGDREPALA